MPIEFRCTKCAKLLRTGDGTAGKQAKCPACQTILTVPASQSPQGPEPPQEPSPFGQPVDQTSQHQNQHPFGDAPAMPAASEYAPPPYYAAVGGGEIRPTQIDFGETFSQTWAAFTDQLGMCILVGFLCLIMNMVAGQAAQFIGVFIGLGAGNELAGLLFSFPLKLAAQLFALWIGIGQAMFFLKVARGQEAPISDIFAGGPYFLRILGASVMLGLGCFLILAVCCLPGGVIAGIGAATNSEELAMVGAGIAGIGALVGFVGYIFVLLMFFQFYYLIIDRNMGIMEAFGVSREIMVDNKATAFGILLVTVILGSLFALFTCLIGLLAVIPYMGILYAILYLSASGQPTMSDFRNMQYQQPQ